jgi:hypothetical protein
MYLSKSSCNFFPVGVWPERNMMLVKRVNIFISNEKITFRDDGVEELADQIAILWSNVKSGIGEENETGDF